MDTNFASLRGNLLQHYIRLAQLPGWGPYTKHRLTQLAADPQFSDFPQLVREALAALPAPSSSTNSATTA